LDVMPAEAFGQHVDEEAADELVRVEPHRLPAIGAIDAIIFRAERNRAVVGCNEAAVRDGDTVGRGCQKECVSRFL
jgi:hypothetical protein